MTYSASQAYVEKKSKKKLCNKKLIKEDSVFSAEGNLSRTLVLAIELK